MGTPAFGLINVYYPDGPPDLRMTALEEPQVGRELRAMLSAERQDTPWRVVRVELPPEHERQDVMYDVTVEPADG